MEFDTLHYTIQYNTIHMEFDTILYNGYGVLYYTYYAMEFYTIQYIWSSIYYNILYRLQPGVRLERLEEAEDAGEAVQAHQDLWLSVVCLFGSRFLSLSLSTYIYVYIYIALLFDYTWSDYSQIPIRTYDMIWHDIE